MNTGVSIKFTRALFAALFVFFAVLAARKIEIAFVVML